MKILNYTKIACTICFALLLYRHTAGLNILLFALILGLCTFALRKVFQGNIIFTYILFFLGACSVFVYGNALSYITCIMAFIAFSGQLSLPGKALGFTVLPGIINLLAAFPGRIADVMEQKHENETRGDKLISGVLKILVIGFVLFIFLMLYMQSSAGFLSFINSIDIDLPKYQFWLLMLLGAFISQAILHHAGKPILLSLVPKRKEYIMPGEDASEKGHAWLSWGTSLLIALNALIIIVIVSDITFIISGTTNGQSPAFFSKLVHEGITSLIVSVILAIIILLLFFEGRINFVKGNITARRLAYTWIACNFCLLILTFYKNGLYISESGLTYKRIGVWYYLAALSFGLVLMYLKIHRDLNVLFVIRKMVPVYLLVLVVSSLLPWEWIVTDHNLNQAAKKGNSPDLYYLSDLDGNNMHLIKAHLDKSGLYRDRYYGYYDFNLAMEQYLLTVRSKSVLSMVLAEEWSASELEKMKEKK